jgi:biotin-(acetyl-CoA carboxylase) ligase
VTTSTTGSLVDTAIVGLGLNLFPAIGRPETSISLSQVDGIHTHFVQDPFPAIADRLSVAYRHIVAKEPDLALARWPSRLAYLNQFVTLEDAGQRWRGTLRGIDPSGALLLETVSGIQTFHAGDLTRGPVPTPICSY